jgi:NAD-specific glutamate dehydrogenase
VLVGAVERLTDWVLRNAAGEGSPSAIAAAFDRVIVAVRTSLPSYFSASEAERFHRRVTEFEVADLDADLAVQLGLAEWLHTILEVDRLAAETGVPWGDVARHWYGVSGWIDFPWLLARIADVDGDDIWHRRAARGLAEDVAGARRRLVQRLCAAGASTTGPDAPGVPRAHAAKVASLIADIKATPRVSSVALHVVVRELAHMCGAREEDA